MSSERPKLAPETPKVITAWISATGRVVYLTKDRNWSEDVADAVLVVGAVGEVGVALAAAGGGELVEGAEALAGGGAGGLEIGRASCRERVSSPV